MGRPRLAPDQRPMRANVRLKPATADAVARYALRRGISVYALLGSVIDRAFALHTTPPPMPACYGPETHSSTLSAVLGESSSTRTKSDA